MTSNALSDAFSNVHAATPLIHCITNFVAMNSTANTLLAIGASPAMLHAVEEVAEFTALADALSINIGTPSSTFAEGMVSAAHTAARTATPWVFDPVAVGATTFRQTLSERLLAFTPTVIRGNASEIMTLAGLTGRGRGVDSTASADEAMDAAIALAGRQHCIVAMTGEHDIVTDGRKHLRLYGGHALMPRVTTLGCALSATVAAFIAANDDHLSATAAALACFAVTGEQAGRDAAGPGSFQIALFDALYQLTPASLAGAARLEVLA